MLEFELRHGVVRSQQPYVRVDSMAENSADASPPLQKAAEMRSRDDMLEENVIGTLARGFQVAVSSCLSRRACAINDASGQHAPS